jgi:hypothetical protein
MRAMGLPTSPDRRIRELRSILIFSAIGLSLALVPLTLKDFPASVAPHSSQSHVAPACVPCPQGGCAGTGKCGGSGSSCGSVTITNFIVTRSGATSVQFSWGISQSGTGTLSQTFYFGPYSGSTTKQTISSNSVSVSGLTSPALYNYALSATLSCGSYDHDDGTIYTSGSSTAGMCPEGAVNISSLGRWVAPDNAMLGWTDTPSTAQDTFQWGTTTSYNLPEFDLAAASHDVGSNLLQFLEPSTTYYFQITSNQAWSTSCYSTGTYQGSFTTVAYSASNTSSDTFYGAVYDASTGASAPSGLTIGFICSGNGESATAITGTGGVFSWQPYPIWCTGGAPGTWQIVTDFGNAWPNLPAGGNQPYWHNHWNETVDAYAPGWVSLYVPDNFITQLPQTGVFVHTPYAQATLASSESTADTTTWNYGGNGGTATATSDLGSSGAATTGETMWWFVDYETTGNYVLNAMDNWAVTLSALSYTSITGSGYLQGTSLPGSWNTDWDTSAPASGSTGAYCTYFSGASASVYYDTGSTYTTTSGYDISIDISGGISFGPVNFSLGVDIPLENELSGGTGSTSQVTVNLTNPNPGTEIYFMFLFDSESGGGSDGNTAIVAHVWQVSSCS